MALAFEPGDPDVLDRPPRPRREGILSRRLWWQTAVAGVVMAAGTLAMFHRELGRTGSLASAQTAALTTMVIFQMFHVGNARAETASLFRRSPLPTPFLFAATAAALVVHVGALYLGPTRFVLRVTPIDLDTWVRIIPVAATILVPLIRRPDTRPPSRRSSRRGR